jgi:2-keto-4-pentenoate hydratase/2-oxohepta-3-ene-1,7-dioic acid hydratase in catechol pathway
MRLLRLGPPGKETPAVLVPGRENLAYDLSGLTPDIDGAFLRTLFQQTITEAIDAGALPTIEVAGVRVGAPIARPHAIYAIGLNYADHAVEAAMELPGEPIVFSKAPNSLCGPTDDVRLPVGSVKGDWEVELGVVIGLVAHELSSPEQAARCIAGYIAVNDVSERAWQIERGGQWLKGKSFPTANPAGPWLVTPDEVGDVDSLRLRLLVNGSVKQDGTTADMVFGPHYLVWYLSQFVRLEPGDLIDTGTPAGVGMGATPPVFLADGDIMELSISGLGEHRTLVHVPAAT